MKKPLLNTLSIILILASVLMFCVLFLVNILSMSLSVLFIIILGGAWCFVIFLTIVTALGFIANESLSVVFRVISLISLVYFSAWFCGDLFWFGLKDDIEAQHTPVINALERYHKDHQRLPKSLHELKPKYLSEIPKFKISPFSADTFSLHYSIYQQTEDVRQHYMLVAEYDIDRIVEYDSRSKYWYQ